jgi:hypothetical protein
MIVEGRPYPAPRGGTAPLTLHGCSRWCAGETLPVLE